MAVIGIELGTTNSLGAYWKDGTVHLIPMEFQGSGPQQHQGALQNFEGGSKNNSKRLTFPKKEVVV